MDRELSPIRQGAIYLNLATNHCGEVQCLGLNMAITVDMLVKDLYQSIRQYIDYCRMTGRTYIPRNRPVRNTFNESTRRKLDYVAW